ncbi:L,D-transpeptidase [Antrihabitans cavernicola]|uniref:L,D-transpeptidase family protein n=1 Tax=Antrihabitans cavernicola TaxID=2495913 RepID=A0A5A7S918_9NOCA|nr:L,D-transpeptidase [Spelaeibacter cavernicola]KAA0019418.1 L,D-transpeptidase family protein [Spelaeibacter cavernicola]
MRLKHVRTSDSPRVSRRSARIGLAIVGVAATGLALAGPAQADPIWPGGPDIPGVPSLIPPGAQLPPLPAVPKEILPPAPQAPSLSPANGEVVGGLRAIDIHYSAPVTDRSAAEAAVKINSSSGTPGHFDWIDDSSLKWSPDSYWPRGTTVNVDAQGAHTAFQVSDVFEGLGDASTHKFMVKIGGDTVKTFPAAFGKPGHESPNGTFPVLEKLPHMVMDSSTYGVPVDSPEGYKLDVDWATRITWDGVFVHAAPWSVDQQGHQNVSHGCINLSTENAKWFFDNVRAGDNVTIQGA